MQNNRFFALNGLISYLKKNYDIDLTIKNY